MATSPKDERAVLASLDAAFDAEVAAAFAELMQLIRAGVSPREALSRVMAPLAEETARALSDALTASIGTAAAASSLPVAQVVLADRLYASAQQISGVVTDIVDRYTRGAHDARELAKALYDGYGAKPPDAEALQISPRNTQLPKYMRAALLDSTQNGLEGLRRAFARMQVNNLSTQALRAAYTGVLDAVEALEAGAWDDAMERRLRVAFEERMRYLAKRIAQTETHRAYMRAEAARIMADDEVEYVQIKRAPGRLSPCICELYTQRDRYGLGPGVYPKAKAPRPSFHPFCRCFISPRLDLTGKTAKPENTDADLYFLARVGEPMAARIVGSRAKLAQVMAGATADDVHAANTPPTYRVRLIGEGTA